jgi:hypothetical protein
MQKSKGGDATGWKRGERGVDREDNSEWFSNGAQQPQGSRIGGRV